MGNTDQLTGLDNLIQMFHFQYLTKSDGNGKIVVIKSYVQNDLLGFSKQQNVRKEMNFTIFKIETRLQ